MIDVTSTILFPKNRHEAEIAILESLAEAKIPQHLHQGLALYLLHGQRPGDFLLAVLKNDLAQAVLRYAGDLNDLHAMVLWLMNCTPSPCSGGPAAVDKWVRWNAEDRQGTL